MKTLKRLLLLSLAVALATSCGGGKKDNQINNNGLFGNPFGNPTNQRTVSQGQVQFSQAQSSQVQQILNGLNCSQGQRLSQVLTYNTTNVSGNRLAGPFNQGSLPGSVSNIYVGRSAWNDVMIVSQISNGSANSGFNVSLYMCSLTSGGTQLISDSRTLNNFQADQGIYLTNNNGCTLGMVAASNTFLLSAATQQYPYPFQVWTSFGSVNACN